ncbi:alpha/beta hydrolase [Amycolatopsis acidiphila]|uniref:Alpha/beta hydrolase n=1 Tax=Amycolatopsis acidiphila TaxID=715473 RepID=A0A558A350_9PSEU|nr:alpha/beta hydrolase [Amycolatopsis acidiphila]TVT18694.1 alpha/beta hydrolase [Amycolatopsis acidiphila]UIJ61568.1 alpha/beta hydrolase [Amycolatopsis acidiphila]GHG59173.1 oxidoreductase [Amycolatopsis acidiphila]
MPEIELSAGTIDYEDTGGDKPVLVFLHGLTMTGTVWRKVVPGLRGEYRCVLPTLPLGAHRRPMRPDADLSLRGMALLVGEFLEKLDIEDVTLVLNDWGGAQFLISEGRAERLARLVLVACEAFDNYPPGLPGKLIEFALRTPGALAATMKLLRFQAFRRAPGAWGWMSKQPVPRAVMDEWFRPAATSPEIRRDVRKYGFSVPPKEILLEWSDRLKAFDRPVLVIWAKEDKLMPREHGPRLAALFPDARLVEVDDSYTLVPEDQPELLVKQLREFVPAARTRG